MLTNGPFGLKPGFLDTQGHFPGCPEMGINSLIVLLVFKIIEIFLAIPSHKYRGIVRKNFKATQRK
jgi:hypothetical protein